MTAKDLWQAISREGKEYDIGTTVFRYTLNKWQNCNYS